MVLVWLRARVELEELAAAISWCAPEEGDGEPLGGADGGDRPA